MVWAWKSGAKLRRISTDALMRRSVDRPIVSAGKEEGERIRREERSRKEGQKGVGEPSTDPRLKSSDITYRGGAAEVPDRPDHPYSIRTV
jgi:hypothetical protein